jgi:hypothetical protein
MKSLAWLLESRQRIPAIQKRIWKDPYTIQIAVDMANRFVVHLLGGIENALKA